MPAMLGLPAALRRYGLTVELVPGWETRGSPSFNPKVGIAHWTAGGKGDRGSLNLCVTGRSDLPGPLCNVFLTRGGVAIVVSGNRANHAGTGGYRGVVGNSGAFGCEAECSGPGDPWTPVQRDAYPRVMAAFCHLMGRDASWVCRHMDWTPRKIDINTWPLADLQARTQALLDAGGADMPLTEQEKDDVAARAAEKVWATILSATEQGPHKVPAMSAAALMQFAAVHAMVAGRATGVGDLALRADVGAARDRILPVVENIQEKVQAVADAPGAAAVDLDYDRLAEAVAPLLSRTVRADLADAVRDVLGSLDNTPRQV